MTAVKREVVNIQRLRDFPVRALIAVRMPEEHAGFAADAMAWSRLRGLAHHRVTDRLKQCISRIQQGGTNPRAVIAVGEPDAALTVADGENVPRLGGRGWSRCGPRSPGTAKAARPRSNQLRDVSSLR